MYFHTDNPATVSRLATALSNAHVQEKRVRLLVDDLGRLKYKIGEGMWSEPIWGDYDPHRDH